MEPRFYDYADLIINNIEGGYYNPARHNTNGMGSSGETMFGMDRKNGGSLFDTAIGQQFWRIIDANSATWPWNYFGGAQESKLRTLAAEIMGQSYEKYSGLYLTDEARKIISKSPRLETHFYYACWNGPGYFQKFAKSINAAIQGGKRKTADLENIAIQDRLTHSVALIRKGGEKMRDKIWPQLPGSGGGIWLWLILGAATIYFLTKKS